MPPKPKTTQPRVPSSKELQTFEWLVVNAGLDPEKFFRQFRKDLAGTADPLMAANNLHRFLTAGFSTAILADFGNHPVLLKIALELFGQSQYLADILVRDPELFRWLTTTNALKVRKSRPEYVNEALASLQLFTRMEKKLDSLKRFHRREMLRVGARDILREASVAIVTSELSALADAVVEAVMELGHYELEVRTGAHIRNTLCVIGLGKLGGEELNFSSDIDLLFVYDEDGEVDSPHERIHTYHEYYNRIAEFVVRKLTEFTSEGHLYRVDMRLRPEGNSGPLALSRFASVQYYEIRGELWERQMLLKARPIAGRREVGTQWLQGLRPFIFPKTVLRSPLDEIRAMKMRIEEQSDVRGNIKLGEGGIRDVEFITQALQLLSGMDEFPPEGNTVLALRRLAGKLIGKKDAERLVRSYEFFRTLEHRLQLLHGTQTHDLPQTDAETTLLARRLGFSSGRSLVHSITKERKAVRTIFDSVFQRGKPGGRRSAGKASQLTVSGLRTYGFIDGPAAEKNLRLIADRLHSAGQTKFWRKTLLLFKKTGSPDWGLRNFLLLADARSIRRTLLQALSKDEMLEFLVLLSSRSRVMTELLAREPLLFETLAGQPEELFSNGLSWKFLLDHDLARFRLFNEFKIILPLLMGENDINQTTRSLSDLADYVLRHVFSRIPGSEKISLVAMGKLGGREITVGSDLDVVLLYDAKEIAAESAEAVARGLAQHFDDGRIYDLDLRLRPEGKNAPLAADIAYYEEYLSKRASLWERQSLTKARHACGNTPLSNRFLKSVSNFLYRSPLPRDWTEEIRKMRIKMENERAGKKDDLKLGKGGLVDLEFFVQLLQLCFGTEAAALRTPNSLQTLAEIKKRKLAPGSGGNAVGRNLAFLREVETMVRLNSGRSDFVLPEEETELQMLAAATNSRSRALFRKKINLLRRQNRRFFQIALRACRS